MDQQFTYSKTPRPGCSKMGKLTLGKCEIYLNINCDSQKANSVHFFGLQFDERMVYKNREKCPQKYF